MTKEQFLKINFEIGQCVNDLSIRKSILEKHFQNLGLTTIDGYRAVQYYYNEICKKIDGKESVFAGKVVCKDNTFCIVNNLTGVFKMTFDDFEARKKLYFPKAIQQKQKKGYQSNLTVKQINCLYEKMQGEYFDTTPYFFKAIFKDKPLPDGSIKWKKTNVLCAYFIKKVFYKDNPFDLWEKAKLIFGLKNLGQSESNNPKPKGHNEIDNILNICL